MSTGDAVGHGREAPGGRSPPRSPGGAAGALEVPTTPLGSVTAATSGVARASARRAAAVRCRRPAAAATGDGEVGADRATPWVAPVVSKVAKTPSVPGGARRRRPGWGVSGGKTTRPVVPDTGRPTEQLQPLGPRSVWTPVGVELDFADQGRGDRGQEDVGLPSLGGQRDAEGGWCRPVTGKRHRHLARSGRSRRRLVPVGRAPTGSWVVDVDPTMADSDLPHPDRLTTPTRPRQAGAEGGARPAPGGSSTWTEVGESGGSLVQTLSQRRPCPAVWTSGPGGNFATGRSYRMDSGASTWASLSGLRTIRMVTIRSSSSFEGGHHVDGPVEGHHRADVTVDRGRAGGEVGRRNAGQVDQEADHPVGPDHRAVGPPAGRRTAVGDADHAGGQVPQGHVDVARGPPPSSGRSTTARSADRSVRVLPPALSAVDRGPVQPIPTGPIAASGSRPDPPCGPGWRSDGRRPRDLPTVTAMSAKGTANTSARRKTARPPAGAGPER